MENNPKSNIENLMENKDVQFRDFSNLNIEVRKRENGTEDYIVEGIACNFDTETVLYKGENYECREKIAKGAFDNCDMTDVIFNYNHCGRVYARTRNNSLKLSVKDDGLHMSASLKKDDRGHEELYNDIKSGLINKMSFAFHVSESTYEYIECNNDITTEIRTITKIDKLYDVSAVDIPAYDTTEISARRAFDTEREKRKAEREERAKELDLAKAKFFYCQN